LALQVARALHYDGARFLDDPTMPQFERDPRDAIVFLNAAYGWDRGTLGVALEDVARRQNIPTAEFAAKRLEYRSTLALHGRGWPLVGTLYRPLLLGLFALLVVFGLERLVLRRPRVLAA